MRQPNKWSCLPTALAILLNKPFEEVIAAIGHDGSREVPGNPYDRRCFYDIEIIMAAYKLGAHLVPFYKYLQINEAEVETLIDDLTFVRLLECHSGLVLLSGHVLGHSVAWSHATMTARDPNGDAPMNFRHSDDRLNIEAFFAWTNPPVFTNI